MMRKPKHIRDVFTRYRDVNWEVAGYRVGIHDRNTNVLQFWEHNRDHVSNARFQAGTIYIWAEHETA